MANSDNTLMYMYDTGLEKYQVIVIVIIGYYLMANMNFIRNIFC